MKKLDALKKPDCFGHYGRCYGIFVTGLSMNDLKALMNSQSPDDEA